MPFTRTAGAALLAGALAAAAALPPAPAHAAAPAPIQVQVDGAPLPLDPAPLIEQGRTLVPLRGLFEALGATVEWDGQTRTVTAFRAGHYVRLEVGSRFACLEPACGRAALLDVPAQIQASRTFIPLRVAAVALGARVTWDAATGTVAVSTAAAPDPAPVTITSPRPGQTVTGPVALQAQFSGPAPHSVRWFLLDPAGRSGPMLHAGGDPAAPAPVWKPDPAYSGPRWLLAAAYDATGRPAYSELVPVTVQPDPATALGGITPGQVITGPVPLTLVHGFQAATVRYERRDPAGKATVLGTADPDHPFTWYPQVAENGRWTLAAVATDRAGREYRTAPVPVTVQATPVAALTGLKENQEVTAPALLRVRANFAVASVQYYLTHPETGAQVLATQTGPDRHLWLPGPELNGPWRLSAVVYDKQGRAHYTAAVPVRVGTREGLALVGVGREQVVSAPMELKVVANRPLRTVDYVLVDPDTGQESTIARGVAAAAAHRWDPAGFTNGRRLLKAVGTDAAGRVYHSAAVPVRIYTGTTHGPRPAVPRDQFLAWAKAQAAAAHRQTDMSVALQVAQAILESAWGQSSPVDKYTGQLSNNLFGIKGTGPAGSVVSNTWEEIDGVAVRMDQNFRAYGSPEESWTDHKQFLLVRPWYAPFRAVMWNPTGGAWALQRSGYATDSRYPLKLIDIMRVNDLYRLDEVTP